MKQKISAQLIKKTAQQTLDLFNKKNCSLTIVICSKNTIQKYNKIYRQENNPTDVLAFEFEKHKKENYLGDILVCSEIASETSKKLKISFEKEISRYVIHGILHLIGFSDKDKKSRKKMRYYEYKILKLTQDL